MFRVVVDPLNWYSSYELRKQSGFLVCAGMVAGLHSIRGSFRTVV